MTVRRPSRPSARRLAAFALVPALALLAACSGGDDDTPAAASGQVVKIGLLAPLKGADAAAGTDARNGARLAVDVINGLNPSIPLPLANESGLPGLGGAKVQLAEADVSPRESSPGVAEDLQVTTGNAVNRLVSTEGVDALIGAYDPLATEYASQRSERYEVPFVNADSPATYLTDSGRNWFFRIGPSWRSAGESFFSLLRQVKVRPGRIAVLYADDKAGQDVVSTVASLVGEDGSGTLLRSDKVAFAPDGSDVAAKVGQLAASKPDTVLLYATPATMAPLIQAFSTAQFRPKIALAFSLGFVADQAFAPYSAVVDGLLRSVAWAKETSERNPAARAVSQLYQRKYNAPMSEAAASGFTAVMTVAQAVDAAGTTDNQRVRSALLSLDVPGDQMIMPWSGIQFDETHQNVLAQALIEQFSNRAFHVVYPHEASASRTSG